MKMDLHLKLLTLVKIFWILDIFVQAKSLFGGCGIVAFIRSSKENARDTHTGFGVKGQEYIFSDPAHDQYFPQDQQDFINPSNIVSFHQTPRGFQTLPNDFQPIESYRTKDLQTSDLPTHLQHTLPQYRQQYQRNEQFDSQKVINRPVGFRPSKQFFQPSTQRLNYSHLFPQSHLRDPTQTETFLGEITLDSPLEPPLEFKNSQEIPEKAYEFIDNSFENVPQNKKYTKNNFLNHRTRIFAPDGSRQPGTAKQYFVAGNGDVYITTKLPFSPKPTHSTTTATTVERKNRFSPTPKATEKPKSFNLRSDKKPFVPKNAISTRQRNSLDIDSLLEEPIDQNNGHNNKDNVEVIQNIGFEEESTTDKIEVVTEDYEYDTHLSPKEYSEEYENDEETNSKHDNNLDLHNEEYDNQDYTENETKIEEKGKKVLQLENSEMVQELNKTYDILSMKPSSVARENNFEDFVDTATMDTTTQETATTNIQLPIVVSMSSSVDLKRGNQTIKSSKQTHETSDMDGDSYPELVVSVVTSKTVINNTVFVPATITPLPTERMSSSTESLFNVTTSSKENSTDSWVVVASVQTSRSVSGTRYLPSPVVEQEERVKLLNEPYPDEHNYTLEDNDYNEDQTTDDLKLEIDTTTEEFLSTIPETSTKVKTSTESLIDKLDRVQSDLSSGLLTDDFNNDNIAVINENMSEKLGMTTIEDMTSSTTSSTSTTMKAPYPQVNIRKFSPGNRPSSTHKPKRVFQNIKQDDLAGLLPTGYKPRYQTNKKSTLTTTQSSVDLDLPQGDQPQPKVIIPDDISSLLPPGYQPEPEKTDKDSSLLRDILSKIKPKSAESKTTEKYTANLLANAKTDDISSFLPPGYRPKKTYEKESVDTNLKQDDVSALLPPGYKTPSQRKSLGSAVILEKAKPVADISALLPPGYKLPKTTTEVASILGKAKPVEDLSALLPPGYKPPKITTTEKSKSNIILSKAKPVGDISAILPPGYKPPKEESNNNKGSNNLFKNADPMEISAFLPPGYKTKSTTISPKSSQVNVPDVPSNLLPPGFKFDNNTMEQNSSLTELSTIGTGSAKPGAIKLRFPSRPGGGTRKSSRLTTPRSSGNEEVNRPTSPTILKAWPSRATTEFTGWPTPSTTPISIEKLLEAARTASTSTSTSIPTTVSSTTTTTTTTTTTPRPTTPGICQEECDLAGTIKLVGGAKWAPELLDRNTKEWQILANEVKSQLDSIYSGSSVLNKWYRKIRIDGFSEGSILVDYLVELNDINRQVDTQEIKRLFYESLTEQLPKENSNREGKSLNETTKTNATVSLGNFEVDPKYTDFVVLPKNAYPTVGYAEDNVLLPQWAIAVIVIGLASLLFVIIFGVTVLVNRQKNAKKKHPAPLTEDMLNELDKNHMGGIENYGADDLYNMEDVWNDRAPEHKPRKKRSNGSIHDNSMSNLYDSWRSEWNGNYYNNYYGNPNSSQHSGYSSRRRSDYDTNF